MPYSFFNKKLYGRFRAYFYSTLVIMFKKYLYYSLFLIASGIILTPLNTFAGTLTNISVVGSSNVTSATTTYTVSFTTENAIPAGPFSAFYMAMNYSLGGNNFSFNSVGTINVTLTVDGVSRSITDVAVTDNVIHIYPSGSISAGANLVFTIQNVVNPNTAGSYGFFDFRTRTTGTDPIDTGSPSSIVIVNPDTATQSPTLTSPTSSSRQNALQLTYSLPEVPSAGTVTVAFNDGTTTTTLTMSDSQSVNTTVNLASLISTSGVVSTTAASLADGTYTVTLSYQDYLGNPASTDVASAVTIDTTANAPIVARPSNNETIQSTTSTAEGTCETGATVSISNAHLQTNPTTVVCSGGVFSTSITFLSSGLNTPIALSFTQTDLVGNVSSATVKNVAYALQTGGGGGGGGIPPEEPEKKIIIETATITPSPVIELVSDTPPEKNTAVTSIEAVKTPTVEQEIIPSIKPYLSSFIKYGVKNNPEDVKKLQIFLNDFE